MSRGKWFLFYSQTVAMGGGGPRIQEYKVALDANSEMDAIAAALAEWRRVRNDMLFRPRVIYQIEL